MMEAKKVSLENNYLTVVDTRYKCLQASFENALVQVKLLHPGIKVHREEIHTEQKVMDGKYVPLGKKLAS